MFWSWNKLTLRVGGSSQSVRVYWSSDSKRGDRLSILVIDDQRDVAEMMQSVLETEGHNCLLASDTDEADRVLAANQVDEVILDLHGPGRFGIEWLETLERRDPGLAHRTVVVTESYLTHDQLRQLNRCGAAVLLNPFQIERLLETVRSHLFDACPAVSRPPGPRPGLAGRGVTPAKVSGQSDVAVHRAEPATPDDPWSQRDGVDDGGADPAPPAVEQRDLRTPQRDKSPLGMSTKATGRTIWDRCDARYPVTSSCVEYEYPSRCRHRSQMLNISSHGLSFGLAGDQPPPEVGLEIDEVVAYVRGQEIKGRLMISHVTWGLTSGNVCGARFFPATPPDEAAFQKVIEELCSDRAILNGNGIS